MKANHPNHDYKQVRASKRAGPKTGSTNCCRGTGWLISNVPSAVDSLRRLAPDQLPQADL